MSTLRKSKRSKLGGSESEPDVCQFLSLEAEVADDTDGEEGDEGDLDGFLQYEPVVADRGSSHAHLALEYHRADHDHNGWHAFLNRAQSRAVVKAAEVEDEVEDDKARTRHPALNLVTNDFLYRVPVQPGQEQILTFLIMEQLSEKLLLVPDAVPKIRSVIGRVSIPGSIFVEALDAEAVYNACKNLRGARVSGMSDIHTISSEDSKLYLREHTTYTPQSPGWVRMTKRPYKGDIAYVYDVGRSFITTLSLIPRIPTDTYLTNEKRKRYNRPPQALFDPGKIRARYGEKSVRQEFASYIFKGNIYTDEGFLQLTTDDFIRNSALPTFEELAAFEKNSYVSSTFIQQTYDAINASALREGDRVRVVGGDLQGCLGVVQSVVSTETQVHIPAHELSATIDSRCLRKDIRVGDEVKVISGPSVGFVGWVVSLGEGEALVLYNHKLHLEVKVSAQVVEFFCSLDFFVNRRTVDTSQQTPSVGEAPATDFNRRFIGRRVVVMGKQHGFKNYFGIIKDVLNDGFATVELEATLRRVRIEMSKLAVSVNGGFMPLNASLPQRGFAELSEASTSQFSAPLTPLPSSWSSSSPAWDPSSRTPIPPSSQPLVPSTPLPSHWSQLVLGTPSSSSAPALKPWFAAVEMAGKHLKAHINGTRPVLRDPGFRHGDLEEKQGIIVSHDNDGANIMFSLGARIYVPSRYVVPIPPTLRGQNVAVISGALIGKEYTVVKYGPLECGLKKRNQRGSKIDETLPTHVLAIVL